MTSLRLVLLIALTSSGIAAAEGSVRCMEDRATCRDGCSLEFGTSFRTREKLGLCLQKCDRDYDTCESSYTRALDQPVKRTAPIARPAPAKNPPRSPPQPAEDDWADEENAAARRDEAKTAARRDAEEAKTAARRDEAKKSATRRDADEAKAAARRDSDEEKSSARREADEDNWAEETQPARAAKPQMLEIQPRQQKQEPRTPPTPVAPVVILEDELPSTQAAQEESSPGPEELEEKAPAQPIAPPAPKKKSEPAPKKKDIFDWDPGDLE